MTKDEKRLLGQLAVVEFRDAPDGKSVSLLNFSLASRIGLVKLPHQKKLGQEEHNKKLHKRRIKTGRRWMNHLPVEFHSKLIETLFLELSPDTIKKTSKTFQNAQLRLNAEDTSSIKKLGWNEQRMLYNIRSFSILFNWFLALCTHKRYSSFAQGQESTRVLTPACR